MVQDSRAKQLLAKAADDVFDAIKAINATATVYSTSMGPDDMEKLRLTQIELWKAHELLEKMFK